MLDPRGRQLLLSSLRPPDGFQFDCAVGTTYTLDLVALLTAPLAFAMFDWQSDDGKLAADPSVPASDPLALLELAKYLLARLPQHAVDQVVKEFRIDLEPPDNGQAFDEACSKPLV